MNNKTGERNTYSDVRSWDESVLNLEDLMEMAEKAAKSRAEYVSKVRAYVNTLRLCPLIIKMYGGMAEVFGVDSFDRTSFLLPLDLKIERPKMPEINSCYYPVICIGGSGYDGP